MNKQISLILLAAALFFVASVPSVSASTHSKPRVITLFEDTVLYDEADDQSEPVGSVSPQTVYVTEMEPGWGTKEKPWYRISTWLGEKWIRPGVAYPEQELVVSRHITTFYDLELYEYPFTGYQTGAYIGPQTVEVVSQLGSWMKIKTWIGERWIKDRYQIVSTGKEIIEQDGDGYVTVSDLQVEKSAIHGHKRLKGGTIQIHKDINGKAIDITLIRQDGRDYTSKYVFIEDQDVNPPKPGEIRNFQTAKTGSDFSEEPQSYRVTVRDPYQHTRYSDYIVSVPYYGPMDIRFGPPSGFPGTLGIDDFHPFRVSIFNTSKQDLTVKPFEMEFHVYRRFDDQQKEPELVYSSKLPEFGGVIETKSTYSLTIPWKQRDNNGQLLPPGSYILKLSHPDTIQFSQEGSEEQTYNVVTDTRHPWNFYVEYVESPK